MPTVSRHCERPQRMDFSPRLPLKADVGLANVRHEAISGLAFAAESGRWHPGLKAVVAVVRQGWRAEGKMLA